MSSDPFDSGKGRPSTPLRAGLTTKILDELRAALTAIDDRQAQDFVAALAGARYARAPEVRRSRTQAREIFVTGQGRSGLIAAAFAMRLAQLGRRVHVVGEPTAVAAAPGALLVACSGSGRTDVTLLHAERALAAGAQVWAITQDPSSPLAATATHVVIIPSARSGRRGTACRASTSERGASSTRPGTAAEPHSEAPSAQPGASAFEQALLLFLDSVIMRLMARLGETESSMLARHANLE